jgi:hypothetical protein
MGLKPDNTFDFLIHELAKGIPLGKARSNKGIFSPHFVQTA